MAEQFKGNQHPHLTALEIARLTTYRDEVVQRRGGHLTVEGIDQTGQDILHLPEDPGASQHIEQAADIIRVSRYAPRLFRRRQPDTSTFPVAPWFTFRQKATIAGITAIGIFGGAALAESVMMVFLGATMLQALPVMAILGAVGGALCFAEARRNTRAGA